MRIPQFLLAVQINQSFGKTLKVANSTVLEASCKMLIKEEGDWPGQYGPAWAELLQADCSHHTGLLQVRAYPYPVNRIASVKVVVDGSPGPWKLLARC